MGPRVRAGHQSDGPRPEPECRDKVWGSENPQSEGPGRVAD